MKRLLLVVLVLTTGCSLLKKKPSADAGADDAGVDAAVSAPTPSVDAGDTADAGDTTVTETAPPPPTSTPGGPFQGTYKCSWGPMTVSQQGNNVTASHMEGKGAVAYVAQCTADGTKCVGSFHATDTKTMKPAKGSGGTVTMTKTPKGDLSYKAGTGAATTCKKQS